MHKYNNYSNTGGFPFDLNCLESDRAGIYEAIAAIYGDAGTTPMILSGSLGGSAWLVINGEILPYTAPGFPPPLMIGMAYYIFISTSSSPATFEDGSVHNVLDVTRSAYLGTGYTATPPAGGILYDSFVPWSKIFGDKARGVWQNFSGSSAQFDHAFSVKKNILTNTVQLKGSIVVKAAVSASNYYYNIGTLPVDCRPANTVPVLGQYRFHATSLKDSTNSDFIDVLNGEIRTDGSFSFGMRKPDSSVSNYTVVFNTVIPLD